MDDEITVSLYSQVKDLAKQFAGKYEIGIAVEIKAILEEREDIQEFHEYWGEDVHYVIDIYLKQFNDQNVKCAFTDVVRFLEYGDATLYTREREEGVVLDKMIKRSHSTLLFCWHSQKR